MATWTSSPLSNPPNTEDVDELRRYLKTTINQFAVMMKELDYVLNGQLDAGNIRAESLTANVIQAGAINADKIDVDQLSAISADMGEITAGIIRGIEIYGSKISTNETGYPRAEMNNTENSFKVSIDEDNYLAIYASYDGKPTFALESPDNRIILNITDTNSYIGSLKTLLIEVGDDILLEPVLGKVKIQNTSKLQFTENGTMDDILSGIYVQLGSLSDRITALGG